MLYIAFVSYKIYTQNINTKKSIKKKRVFHLKDAYVQRDAPEKKTEMCNNAGQLIFIYIISSEKKQQKKKKEKMYKKNKKI